MATCTHVLVRKCDPDENYSARSAYDEACRLLDDHDVLHLSYDGMFYPFDDAADPLFIDGAVEPEKIRNTAAQWVKPYANQLSKHIIKLINSVGLPTYHIEFQNLLTGAIMSYGDGFQLYKTVNQLFGYPDFGVDQLYIDEQGNAATCPSPDVLQDISAHPENYYSICVYYK